MINSRQLRHAYTATSTSLDIDTIQWITIDIGICQQHSFDASEVFLAAAKDIRYAMKRSGHVSTKYIWRYTEPGGREFDEALKCSMT